MNIFVIDTGIVSRDPTVQWVNYMSG